MIKKEVKIYKGPTFIIARLKGSLHFEIKDDLEKKVK